MYYVVKTIITKVVTSKMANKAGLGVSKKFTVGSIHESASGTFNILERYAGDEGQAWLKIEWLSGGKAGQIEDNKEVNVNASIHKFQVSRGRSGETGMTHRQGMPFLDRLDKLIELSEHNIEVSASNSEVLQSSIQWRESVDERMLLFKTIIDRQQDTINTLARQMNHLIEHNNLLQKQQDALNKLIDKLV